jgi:hypothetical protein
MKPASYWQSRLSYLLGRFLVARRDNHALLTPLARAISLAKRRLSRTHGGSK